MTMQKFDLAALAEIDNGRVAAAFKHALARCEADCKDRPAHKKARTITLSVDLMPECSAEGDLRSVDVLFKVKDSVPTRTSATYNMKAVPGGLVYNELSPEEAAQLTLDDVGPRIVVSKETGEVLGAERQEDESNAG